MSSPYVPDGPEATPTLSSQSSSSSLNLSPASTASVVIFLSCFALAALAAAFCWVRKRRTILETSDERPSKKEAAPDVEAMAANRPIIPVTPLPDVRWTPQIRSISGPVLDETSDRKYAALHTKRARSPPPSGFLKPRSLLPDPYPKSAPAHALSFPQHELPYPPKSPGGYLEPPVTPLALAVSGMQTRSLGKHGQSS